MAVAARPLAYATGKRAADVAEVTTTKVEPEFFEGVLDLGPGVIPSHGFIAAVEIVDVLNDIAWVVEGELQLVARHGEDAAQTTRHGLQLGREMGAVGRESYVVDKVLCRHDAKAGVEQQVGPVDGFEVGFPTLAMVAEHLQHRVAQVALTGQCLQLPHSLLVAHKSVFRIPTLGYSPP